MARGGLDFEGIGYRAETYKAGDSVKTVVAVSGNAAVEGKAVTITGNAEADYGSVGDRLLGIINHYESDDYMTVQTGGYATFEGVSGSLPTAGTDDVVVVDGSGAVQASVGATGRNQIISVDTTEQKVVVLIG